MYNEHLEFLKKYNIAQAEMSKKINLMLSANRSKYNSKTTKNNNFVAFYFFAMIIVVISVVWWLS